VTVCHSSDSTNQISPNLMGQIVTVFVSGITYCFFSLRFGSSSQCRVYVCMQQHWTVDWWEWRTAERGWTKRTETCTLLLLARAALARVVYGFCECQRQASCELAGKNKSRDRTFSRHTRRRLRENRPLVHAIGEPWPTVVYSSVRWPFIGIQYNLYVTPTETERRRMSISTVRCIVKSGLRRPY